MTQKFENYANTENEKALQDFFSKIQFGNMSMKMQAVRKLIHHFRLQDDPEVDFIFVHDFPNELFEEFQSIKTEGSGVKGYHEKKILFFDVFTFIFRSRNLLMDIKTQPYIYLFLEFIKNYDDGSVYNANDLINSIMVCVSYPPNKVLFIHENCMVHFYSYFNISLVNLIGGFWKMCEHIYNLDYMKNAPLCSVKLSNCLVETIETFNKTKDERFSRLLLIIFKMLHRHRLIELVQFDVLELYWITVKVFMSRLPKIQESYFINYLPKIWIGILSPLTNLFQIDVDGKLLTFACIFSADLSNKLKKVVDGSGKFEVTNNKKQKLYIIYLTMNVYTFIDQTIKMWLRPILMELHTWLQKYFEKCSIQDYSFENQFLLLQYYLKSLVTLGCEILRGDLNIFKEFLSNLKSQPSLNLHYHFLISHFILKFPEILASKELNPAPEFIEIESFLSSLILVLGGDIYITKLKRERSLLFYEDLMSVHLPMITPAFISSVYFECWAHLLKTSEYWIPENIGSAKYKMNQQILTWIVVSLNDDTYLSEDAAKYYTRLCNQNSNNSPTDSKAIDNCLYVSDSAPASNTSKQINTYYRPTVSALLKCFMYVYELKFIFGGINSRIINLDVLHSHRF
ncbi:hypothetical protein RF11_07472 [Thelohanellus kitauei]|uniref:Uncharacterized protein n=1 Tax=Thelohanellus kitauei TaxID=669202 RepID=A0A0C2MTX1_THEKT|nr:hypothetical protein RF11_07472 [Thelohanellus kitauei]